MSIHTRITTFHNKLMMVYAKCRQKFYHLNKYTEVVLLSLTSRQKKEISSFICVINKQYTYVITCEKHLY